MLKASCVINNERQVVKISLMIGDKCMLLSVQKVVT